MSAAHSYRFKAFLRVLLIVTILSHFYEGALFLLFQAIFTSAPDFYYFKPILRVRLIPTILSHFYDCASFLPF